MPRTLERLEGLALVGGAAWGPLSFSTPALLESRTGDESGPGLSLRAA